MDHRKRLINIFNEEQNIYMIEKYQPRLQADDGLRIARVQTIPEYFYIKVLFLKTGKTGTLS